MVLRGVFSFSYFVLKRNLIDLFPNEQDKNETIDLNELASSALKQINEKKYETELIDAKVTTIHKISIAFRGKNAVVKSDL